ncbi:MAG: hypothetical protein IT495_11325 [Gammaproteobacteria bacterium]|nr:hypothetical protein [Gammaproteobacteria bacterium]
MAISIGRFETAALRARSVQLDLVVDGDQARMTARATRVSWRGGIPVRSLACACDRGYLSAVEIACRDGHLEIRDPALGSVRAAVDGRLAGDGFQARLVLAGAGGAGPADALSASLAGRAGGWHARVDARGLDLAWLAQAVAHAGVTLPVEDVTGRADLAGALNGDGGELTARFERLGFQGANVGEELAGSLSATVGRAHDTVSFSVAAELRAGLAYVEPGFTLRGLRPGFTLEVPARPLSLRSAGHWYPVSGRVDLNLHYVHPGVADVEAQLQTGGGADAATGSATVTVKDTDAARLYGTYLKPMLLGTTWDELDIAGAVGGTAQLRAGVLRSLALELQDVHLYDGRDRFHVAGLDGSVVLNPGEASESSALSWSAAGLYRIALGGGRVAFTSQRGEIVLQDWTAVPVLDGELAIDRFSIDVGEGKGFQLQLAGRLREVSMQELTTALGWHVMQGRVSGAIDGLHYRNGAFELDGELAISVFDGRVRVRNLALDDLFELVPRLHADIDIERLDLEQLTDTFSFGTITGRLSGYVHELELQAWQPVHFDAELATPADDTTRHRISQRAVDNLGAIGGGSGGAVSRGLLRFFKEYSYDRLGISCRLYNGYCQLGGVEDTEGGFHILTRGGLLPPWIDVKGSGRSIAWRVLVDGLQTIGRGEVIIQ